MNPSTEIEPVALTDLAREFGLPKADKMFRVARSLGITAIVHQKRITKRNGHTSQRDVFCVTSSEAERIRDEILGIMKDDMIPMHIVFDKTKCAMSCIYKTAAKLGIKPRQVFMTGQRGLRRTSCISKEEAERLLDNLVPKPRKLSRMMPMFERKLEHASKFYARNWHIKPSVTYLVRWLGVDRYTAGEMVRRLTGGRV